MKNRFLSVLLGALVLAVSSPVSSQTVNVSVTASGLADVFRAIEARNQDTFQYQLGQDIATCQGQADDILSKISTKLSRATVIKARAGLTFACGQDKVSAYGTAVMLTRMTKVVQEKARASYTWELQPADSAETCRATLDTNDRLVVPFLLARNFQYCRSSQV